MKSKTNKRIRNRKTDCSNKYRHEIDIVLNNWKLVGNKEIRCRWCLFILFVLALVTIPAISELSLVFAVFAFAFLMRRHVLMRRIYKAQQQVHELYEEWIEEESPR